MTRSSPLPEDESEQSIQSPRATQPISFERQRQAAHSISPGSTHSDNDRSQVKATTSVSRYSNLEPEPPSGSVVEPLSLNHWLKQDFSQTTEKLRQVALFLKTLRLRSQDGFVEAQRSIGEAINRFTRIKIVLQTHCDCVTQVLWAQSATDSVEGSLHGTDRTENTNLILPIIADPSARQSSSDSFQRKPTPEIPDTRVDDPVFLSDAYTRLEDYQSQYFELQQELFGNGDEGGATEVTENLTKIQECLTEMNENAETCRAMLKKLEDFDRRRIRMEVQFGKKRKFAGLDTQVLRNFQDIRQRREAKIRRLQ